MPWTEAWLVEYLRRTKGEASLYYAPVRIAIYDKQKGRCPWCGLLMTRAEATLEHIIPRRPYKGTNQYENLALAHNVCNNKRGNNIELRPVEGKEFNFISERLDNFKSALRIAFEVAGK